jgi:hypothetical protein
VKVILKRGHRTDCFMANSDRMPGDTGHRPGDPWCLNYKDAHQFGDKRGGKTGHTLSFVRLQCLDPKCKAEVLVEEFGLWEKVNEALI